jgi:hypothetical protein
MILAYCFLNNSNSTLLMLLFSPYLPTNEGCFIQDYTMIYLINTVDLEQFIC